jgi:hypothetical protein
VTHACCRDTCNCVGGLPTTCSAGCAQHFLPFWSDCRDILQTTLQQAVQPALTKCQATVSTATGTCALATAGELAVWTSVTYLTLGSGGCSVASGCVAPEPSGDCSATFCADLWTHGRGRNNYGDRDTPDENSCRMACSMDPLCQGYVFGTEHGNAGRCVTYTTSTSVCAASGGDFGHPCNAGPIVRSNGSASFGLCKLKTEQCSADESLPGQTTCTLPTDANGQWSAAPAGGFVIGSTTTLTCDPGYIVHDIFGQEQTLTCGTITAGQWDGVADVCLQSSSTGPSPPATGVCPLPTTTNGDWSTPTSGASFVTGETTVLTCHPGYVASPLNSVAITCGADGWIGGGVDGTVIQTCTAACRHGTQPSVIGGQWSPSQTFGGSDFGIGATSTLSCTIAGQTPSTLGASVTCHVGTPTPYFVWTSARATCAAGGHRRD